MRGGSLTLSARRMRRNLVGVTNRGFPIGPSRIQPSMHCMGRYLLYIRSSAFLYCCLSISNKALDSKICFRFLPLCADCTARVYQSTSLPLLLLLNSTALMSRLMSLCELYFWSKPDIQMLDESAMIHEACATLICRDNPSLAVAQDLAWITAAP
jgi:hypothetical protein